MSCRIDGRYLPAPGSTRARSSRRSWPPPVVVAQRSAIALAGRSWHHLGVEGGDLRLQLVTVNGLVELFTSTGDRERLAQQTLSSIDVHEPTEGCDRVVGNWSRRVFVCDG